MRQAPGLRRVVAWADRLLHPEARAAPPAPPPAAAPPPPAAAPPAPPAAALPAVAATPPTALAPAHREGLRLAEDHRWNQAQRALERAARAAPAGPAAADLASVRAVRRQRRLLAKWPRDAAAQLALGRAYFELGLGRDAEAAFQAAVALAPQEPAGHAFLTLEYAYRGDLAAAARHHAAAQARGAALPPLAALLADLAPPPAAGAAAAPGSAAGEASH